MLLVASVGVATVSYALAACEKQPAGNLAPPQPPVTADPVSGNLAPPPAKPDLPDAAPPAPVASDNAKAVSPTGGNLMAPPRPEPSASTAPAKPKPPPHAGNLMPPPKKE